MSELDVENRIVAALRQIMRAVDLHSRRLVETCGLTGPQLAVLFEAHQRGPASATVIARGVHLSLPTVAGILTRLEKRGFVERRKSANDRRATTVTVTEEGLRMIDQSPSLLQDQFRQELTRLEEWERFSMLSVLQRIAAIMGAESLDAAPHLVTHGSSVGTESAEEKPDAAGILSQAQKLGQ